MLNDLLKVRPARSAEIKARTWSTMTMLCMPYKSMRSCAAVMVDTTLDVVDMVTDDLQCLERRVASGRGASSV